MWITQNYKVYLGVMKLHCDVELGHHSIQYHRLDIANQNPHPSACLGRQVGNKDVRHGKPPGKIILSRTVSYDSIANNACKPIALVFQERVKGGCLVDDISDNSHVVKG
jgi:hypothetical protein